MSGEFSGKVALVTGAASGMGRATTCRLLDAGCQVLAVDVNADALLVLAEELATTDLAVRAVDVGDSEECVAAVDFVVSQFGGLDLLFNVAGLGGICPLEEETAAHWQLVMNVNINGPFYLSQAALPQLLQRGGNIVNVASTAGVIGQAYMASYTASKHALVGLTKSMALEFGRKGLRVNAVCPGGTNTQFLKGFSAMTDAMDADLISRMGYLSEFAEPEDIAESLCFLASDKARFINGAVLSVDGGAVAG